MKDAHSDTIEYLLGLADGTCTIIWSMTVGIRELLNTCKQLPYVGWAVAMAINGFSILKTLLKQGSSWQSKLKDCLLALGMIGLATVSMLLPLLVTAAVVSSILSPIATGLLGAVGAFFDFKEAWNLQRSKGSSALDKGLAWFNAALGVGVFAALVALAFPGAQFVAAPVLIACIAAKLLLSSYKLGKACAERAQATSSAKQRVESTQVDKKRLLRENALEVAPVYAPASKRATAPSPLAGTRKQTVRNRVLQRYHSY